MTALETLTVEIAADTAKLDAALAEVGNQVAEIEKTLQGLPAAVPTLAAPADAAGKTTKNSKDPFDDLVKDAAAAVHNLSVTVAAAFADMAAAGEFSAKKIGQAFLSTFLNFVQQTLIQKPLESLLGTILGALTGTPVETNASGGVIAAGVPTFINERGQEIFIPHVPGRIVNADDTRRMFAGGAQVVVKQDLHFDAAIKNDMIATIFQASPILIEQTKRAVIESLQGRRF